jgi:hypothetical protein
MTIGALIVVFSLTGILLSLAAIRRLRQRRLTAGIAGGTAALLLFLVAASIGLIAANLRTYSRLSHEQPAAELQFTRLGDRQFNAVLSYPAGGTEVFALRGDEWQIDARVLKWRAFANILGFDTIYRLERIGGRYTRIEDERSAERSVYSLNPPPRLDLWDAARRYKKWLPWLDALYGSATYLPMADGALYEISVSQSGLTARPLNQAARDAVVGWH